MMEGTITIEEDIVSSSSARGNGRLATSLRVLVQTRPPRPPLINRKLILILGVLVILVLSAILVSLVVHWYYLGWKDGQPRLRYNHEKMANLQPKVLSKVKGLWDTTNRSIHDGDARDFMRNLSKTDRSTCYSALCIHTAKNFLENMDWKIDPCEDFYTFACGGWITRNPPDLSTSVTDHFAKINDRVVQATQRIIEKAGEHEGPPNDSNIGVQLAKEFYNECTNIEQLERDGLDPIIKILESHGGWPLLYGHAPNDTWKSRWSFNWLKLAAVLQKLQNSAILSLEIKQDATNQNVNSIYIIEPNFFVNRQYLVNPEKNTRPLTAYKLFIVDVALELLDWKSKSTTPNLRVDRIRLDDMAESVIMFEVSLAKLVTPDTTISNVESFYEIDKFQEETDKFWTSSITKNKLDWKQFFDLVFEGSDITIGSHEKVLIHDMPYIQGLAKLLDHTPTETLANYLLWRLMVKFTSGSTKTLRKVHAKFFQDLYGEQNLMDRNTTCAMVINNKFAIALGAEFVKDSFEASLKREVETLAANVKIRMEELLGRQSFIPHLLQLAIRRKLASIKLCVGYPSSFSNSTYVSQFYKDLDMKTLKNGTYVEKYMSISTWLYLKSLSVLRQPFDQECWGGNYWSFIGEAYAYYDTARNSINLPVGLLQSPFYIPSVPWYLNYGGVGTIIGHELTHRYRTRSENFCDHVGLASAFFGYQQHIKSMKHNEEHLPGLEFFTNAQMFFVSFANMWCDSKSSASLEDEIKSSTHTPSKYRVLGALKHSKDFAETWSCEPGSKMNPRRKCNLF